MEVDIMENKYQILLGDIMYYGDRSEDRTGVGTRSMFGKQLEWDLADGFPLLTTKKVHIKSIIYELLWMLKGDTNVRYLNDNGVTIWNEWADKITWDLGPIYGKQWRSWANYIYRGHVGEYVNSPIDQIKNVVESIKNDPYSRRHIVTAWNPAEIDKMALPPCHVLFQFYVRDNKLSCQLYQRSADIFLGVPFNIASYSLLTMMIAQVCGLELGRFIHTFGDIHIYSNHEEQVEEQLMRTPYDPPKMRLNKGIKDIDDFKYEDFALVDYKHYPAILGDVAI